MFCGSQPGKDPKYAAVADAVGRAIAERGFGLVYGGARVGTMGMVADAALAAGAPVYGVIPERLSRRELAHEGLDELFVVDSMHARKTMMAHLSDAFCVLPGGFGTLEEAFEILTWSQLGYHRKPLGLVNPDRFFDHLVAYLDGAVQAGFLLPEHRALLFSDPDPQAVLDHLATAEPPELPRWIDKP